MDVEPTDLAAGPPCDLTDFGRRMSACSPLAIALVDGPTSILEYINPAFCRLIGSGDSELAGMPFASVLPEGEICLPLLERVHRTGDAETCTKQAAGAALSYVMWPVLGSNGSPMGVMVQVADGTLIQHQAAEMNQSLLLAGIRQHELIEAAEKQNVQLQQEIHERVRAEKALKEFVATLEIRVAERTFEVHHQADRLRALASELSRVEQRERKRLARILHDHIQQLMAAAIMQLTLIQRALSPEGRLEAIHGAEAMLREAMDASRSLARDLSPPALHENGLLGGLGWLATSMKQKHQFTVHLHLESEAEPADEEIRLLLFECARELLFNAVKHAGIGEALLTLARGNEGQTMLIVADQGKGFDLAQVENGQAEATFGLFSVKERLMHLGGEIKIETAPGSGTKITLVAPPGVGKAE